MEQFAIAKFDLVSRSESSFRFPFRDYLTFVRRLSFHFVFRLFVSLALTVFLSFESGTGVGGLIGSFSGITGVI